MKTFRPLLLTGCCLGAPLLHMQECHAQDYTIPVVVHVLWDGPIENISEAQILNALEVLNTGFNSLSYEPIDATYQPIAASMDIEFCLASIAPDGSPTTGIERFETPLADQGGLPESYINQWPPDHYLNIWTIGAMEEGAYQTTLSPAEAELDPARDGIMVHHFMFGEIGTSNYFEGKTIIFHAGRFLDLKVLWQDPVAGGPCGNDGVADTPLSDTIIDCLNPAPDGCAGTLPVMEENYMTYSGCNRMFTQGQRDRVHAALNSVVAQRNNLWSASNLGSTGCGPVNVHEHGAAQALDVVPQGLGRWLVHGPGNGAWSLAVYCTTGRLITAVHAMNGPVQLDLSGHAPGLYVLRAGGTAGVPGHAKVVVE